MLSRVPKGLDKPPGIGAQGTHQGFSMGDDFAPQDIFGRSGDVFGECDCHRGMLLVSYWVKARGATKHPTMGRTGPAPKEFPSPDVGRDEGLKPWTHSCAVSHDGRCRVPGRLWGHFVDHRGEVSPSRCRTLLCKDPACLSTRPVFFRACGGPSPKHRPGI